MDYWTHYAFRIQRILSFVPHQVYANQGRFVLHASGIPENLMTESIDSALITKTKSETTHMDTNDQDGR